MGCLTNDGLKKTWAKIKAKIDSIQVGGRNYLATNRCTRYVCNGIIFEPNGDGGIAISGENKTPSGYGSLYNFPTGPLNTNEYYSLFAGTYTLSLSGSEHYVNMITDSRKFYYRLRRDSSYGADIPYKWVGNAITFTLDEDVEKVYIGFGFYSTVEIKEGVIYFKLEKGNKPTDWTPAPEDVNSSISNALTEAKKYTDSKVDSSFIYKQSGRVFNSYGNATTKCGTTNGTHTNLPAFTTVANGNLSSLCTKVSSNQIKINKSGIYSFQMRFEVNSGTANKRVEIVPFINGERTAKYGSTYATGGNFTLINFANYILELTANDTVDFRIAPIDSTAVSVRVLDATLQAIDWDGKFVNE